MLQVTDSFQKIIKSASPNSRAIIESLSKKLNLVENNRYAETEKKIESLKKSRDELAKKKKTKEDERKTQNKDKGTVEEGMAGIGEFTAS